jgi:transposase
MNDVPRPEQIDPADWEQTPIAVRALIAALIAQVQELAARLDQHSGNSSRPPSADPPAAPLRPKRPPRGKRRGAQHGHPGAHRALLPPEQVDDLQLHRPLCCPHCHADLPTSLPECAPAERRQIVEVPAVRPQVTEHQLLCVQCPHCAVPVRASMPADTPPGAFGPNLLALVALLHGRFRLSEREVRSLLDDLFGIDMALGSVAAACQTVSTALQPAYQQVQQALAGQKVANADETGWKQAGQRRWLWVAVSGICTVFRVATGRNQAALSALLGGFQGVLGSDRLSTYDVWPVARRQLCWAHLKRNITWFSEREGRVQAWAAQLLKQVAALFTYWHQFRSGAIDRRELGRRLEPVQQQMHALLEQGQQLPLPKAVRFSNELLERWRALWAFLYVEGVEPTNNAAERALRPAVLWRKGCFGAQSAAGNQFVERLLTVRATCTQQERHLWTFLSAAVVAHWADQPPPVLVATPT